MRFGQNRRLRKALWTDGVLHCALPVARPHASRARLMALVRPRGELGHIRPKLPSCMARSRPSLGAPARPACPRDGLDGNDNGANSDDEHTEDRISSRLYTYAQRTVPSSSVGCTNANDNNSGLF
ncbi:hypothetical protein PIB30_072136 [Stylosanthes scabra]|uniref:Uncharacterized protein n=1 Tax=Stylosanthes scabra TaxID=79078 RepID=A0ABU6XMH2_9FABA|nr:hypothetical protein [Stylosanthes scabra]